MWDYRPWWEKRWNYKGISKKTPLYQYINSTRKEGVILLESGDKFDVLTNKWVCSLVCNTPTGKIQPTSQIPLCTQRNLHSTWSFAFHFTSVLRWNYRWTSPMACMKFKLWSLFITWSATSKFKVSVSLLIMLIVTAFIH